MTQTETTLSTTAPIDESLLGGGATNEATDTTLLGKTEPAAEQVTQQTPQKQQTAQEQHMLPGLAPLPENATDSQRQEFNMKLRALNGAPDAPDKYGTFGFGDDVKIDTNSEDYKYYTNVFHELGLNQKQAKTLLEKHKEYADKQVEQIRKFNENAISEYRSKIKNDFIREQGGQAAYEVFRATAEQGFKATAQGAKLTPDDIKGLLNIMGDDPRFVKVFHHIGQNFREDVLVTGVKASASEPTMEKLYENLFNKGV